MKKLKLFFTALLLLCCIGTATAHDFEVGGIYYNITDDTNKTIEVTYGGEYSDEYTGNVVIPKSVTYNGTTYSVTSIGNFAFYNCTGLTSITIPNSVTSIGNKAFSGCTGITSITIPNSVTSIGVWAFEGCTGITSITIPNSVTSIGYRAFYGTAWYNNQPDGVVYAGKVLYEYKGTMPSNTSITIKDGTLGIAGYAFYGCTGLTSIEIPNSVTSIGGVAFSYCSGLTSITIPNSVTSIEDWAFNGCTGLTSITIPNSVTSIGNNAFEDCKGLTSIKIPNSVTSIGENAFEGCTGLTSVVIPNSVTSIGGFTFYNCTGLTSIEIPNSVTSIGERAFEGCTGLKTVYNFSNLTFSKGSSYNGYVAYYADKVYNAPNGFIDGDFIWSENGDGMTLVGYLGNATELALPADYKGKSVTSIGDEAFYKCSGLTSIVIGNSVTSIGEKAFNGCSGLKTVYNFSNLTFSKGSSYNGYVAYYADKVYNAPNGFIDGDFIWSENEDGMTLAGYLGNATELTLPADYKGKSVTSIGDEAFRGCTGFTSIEIPNSVTSIGASAFEGCNNIEKLYIGSSVESIGDKAFTGCEKITEIKVALEKPIRGSADIFADAVYDNATLYIPNGTEQLYQKREPWNLFFYIAEMDFTGIDEVLDEVKSEPTVDASQNGEVQTIYDLNGRKVVTPKKGLYIIDGKKVLVK